MKRRIKYFFLGILVSIIFFVFFGVPTAVIPTSFFTRMNPATIIDYALLALTSVLAGAYVSYILYQKSRAEEKSGYAALGGTIAGALSFSCPVCSVLLVSIFGSSALLVFFEPYRHYLGLLVIALFAFAFYKARKCRECSAPNSC